VKHLVQDWDSQWCRPLHHNKIFKRHLIGLDANILKGKDAEDDSGKEYHSSMANTKVWREIYEEMKEEMAVKLGWKRKTHLFVVHFEDHKLPEALSKALYEKKNGFVRVRGTNMVVPYMWILQAQTIFIGRWKNPSRRHTMVTNNSIDNSKKFSNLLRILWPKMLATIPNTKANKNIKKRLAKTHIVSIYDLGKNGRQISKQLSNIPIKHKDSIISQVKLLTEGWDPKNAWLDSWAFADPAHSKIRIYQVGGRPARIGNDIHNPSMRDSMCFVPYIIQSDLSKELAINAANRTLSNTAEAMQIGKDTIEDVTTFFDANQFSVPSVRTKGSKNKKAMIVVGITKLMNSFVNYYQSGRRWSPWAETVSAMFQDTMKFYDMDKFGNKDIETFYNSIYTKKEYKPFLKNHSVRPQLIVAKIRLGDYWILTAEEKDTAKNKLAVFEDKTMPNIYKMRWQSYADAARTLISIPIDSYWLTAGGHGYYSYLARLIPAENKNRICSFFTRPYVGGCATAPEEFKTIKAECAKYKNMFDKKVEDKIAEVKKDFINHIARCLNPCNTQAFGELNKAMQKKYRFETAGHAARFVKYQGLRPLLEQARLKNHKLVLGLYLKHANNFLKHPKKSLRQLDLYVMQEASQLGLTQVDPGYVIEQIRKKSRKMQKYNREFFKKKSSLTILNRKKYTVWNSGKTSADDSRILAGKLHGGAIKAMAARRSRNPK
jgi:hypothetical protein